MRGGNACEVDGWRFTIVREWKKKTSSQSHIIYIVVLHMCTRLPMIIINIL